MSYIMRLAELTDFTSDNGALHDWAAVSAEIGAEVPRDFRQLVDSFGVSGCFDGFIWIFEPGHRNPHLNFTVLVGYHEDVLDELWDGGEESPSGLDRESMRLISFAGAENGATFYWLAAKSVAPEDWPVLINESRGPEWYSFNMPATELLYRILTGELSIDLFECHLPVREHSFVEAPPDLPSL